MSDMIESGFNKLRKTNGVLLEVKAESNPGNLVIERGCRNLGMVPMI